jgi:hypothetical protein
MKKILITLTVLSIISFFTFASIYNVQQDVQRASKQEQQPKLETYDYVITGKDNQGYYGKSLKDDTGIFLVQSNLPKDMELNENDHIRVSFPNEQWDVITKIEKLKGVN